MFSVEVKYTKEMKTEASALQKFFEVKKVKFGSG